jgi:2-succinyl-6-hydroxy-2,4-cyclohexadiene-1-carboxylate synthase|tara:strand:+ start:5567 stop:6412 length:846 start_codon:yes stop_codon:yes gene_type:complete
VIQTSKETDEKIAGARRAAKSSDEALVPTEFWCLHGAVGAASDWRALGKGLAEIGASTRAVDLWRFLQCESVSMPDFGKRLNADSQGEVSRGQKRILFGYSMGGRLALHALLEKGPWDAAVIISANPGLRDPAEISARRASDTVWATQALTLAWGDFLQKWNSQPILGGAMRDEREDKKLIQRRREIARSFVDWSVTNQQPLWNRLPEIQIPTLWIAGETDTKYRAIAEEAVALLPNATLAIAPNAGHRVPWENEAWLLGAIEEWRGFKRNLGDFVSSRER